MSARERLPNRHASETITFECRGLTYTATLGFYADGRLGEVFMRAGKAGTHLDITTHESAIAISVAFQHGAKPDDVRKSFLRGEGGDAEGPLGTLLDILAKRPRLVSVQPGE